jgi:hypothetical protein
LELAQNEDFDLFLFFSASHPKIQEEAVECGAQGFVLKPDIDALHNEISRTLRAA